MAQRMKKRVRMRNGRSLAAGAGAVAVVTLGLASCFNYLDDCWRLGTCPPGVGGAGGSGGDGGVNTACVPSVNGEPVAESCGVFVSSSQGDDANDGSQAKPVRTLAKALELAGSGDKAVYACGEVFDEVVTIETGAVLYGGLDCSNGWQYGGASSKTSIVPGADGIPVTLKGGAGTTHIEDVVIRAADAAMDGGSSIAAVAEQGASVELVRCDIASGNARDGAKGATPSDLLGPSDPNDLTIRGTDGLAACMGDLATGNLGGTGTANSMCVTSIGGNGGAGMVTSGADGTDGQPAGAAGKHGTGQPSMGAWSCGTVGNGQGGDVGANGTNAAGASMQDLGTLSSTGFTGAAGIAGSDGAPGQGGGGGGGAKGKVGCNGASGGGGGAGGCGGKGGLGGQAGGASIALVSLGATLSFTEVTLTAGNGGNGGEGGDGQGGAIGGAGGFGGLGDANAPTTLKACAGGEGGPGGTGGKGGGGRGGHSLGIAFQGSAPTIDGVTIVVGTAGQGGLGADAAGQGAGGVASLMEAFP